MSDPVLFLVIILVSFVATFIAAMAGGGSSIIMIPIYLLLGIPFPAATAINQTSSVFWVLPASRNYLKGRHVNWHFVTFYAMFGTIGAVVGALLVSRINEKLFTPIIGAFILMLVAVMAVRKGFGTVEKETEARAHHKKLFYITAPFLGFYESVFGSGNGVIFSGFAIKLRGTDLTKSLGYYYVISFFWLVISSAILIHEGHLDIPLMIATTIGAVGGGYFGSKLGRHKGNHFVKYAFMIIGTILGLKLVLGL